MVALIGMIVFYLLCQSSLTLTMLLPFVALSVLFVVVVDVVDDDDAVAAAVRLVAVVADDQDWQLH